MWAVPMKKWAGTTFFFDDVIGQEIARGIRAERGGATRGLRGAGVVRNVLAFDWMITVCGKNCMDYYYLQFKCGYVHEHVLGV